MRRIEKSSLYLYAAYTSSCLEDRAWSFCVSLCMALLGGIQLVSIEQMAEGLTQIFFSGLLGNQFDKSSRKAAIRAVIPLNNLSLVTSALCFIGCLSLPNDSHFFPILLIIGIIFCSINRLFLNAEKFILGRDWVVVISNRNLSDLNAILTTLDQFANVISPLVTGGLVSLIGLKSTCAIFGIGSLVSMISKIFFLRALYKREEGLHQKETLIEKKAAPETSRFCDRFSEGIQSIPNVISIYYEQTVFSVALGMSLLFMTVLGFDGLAISYGQSTGLPEALLGGFKSFGSFMGIAGALSYAFFEKRFGVRKTGLIGLTSQHVFTMMALVSIWLPGSPMNLGGYFHSFSWHSWWDELKDSFTANGTVSNYQSNIDWNNFTANGNSMFSIFVFLTGIAIARFGLWMADLSVMHIMQVAVPERQRNTVFGVHNSLCQSFSVLKDLLVIALPDPRTFGLCIIISYLFVTTGHLCYIYYIIRYPEPANELEEEKLSNISTDDEKKDIIIRL
ncbi:unnamed protein product [Auanema sp. JU1783]|nr:unnamed protein product [Auanema sp. JU1783]